MKTAKLVMGIVSIVLTFVVLFQSCAAGLGEAIADEGGTSGGVGVMVALVMLIAGIVVIATRRSKGGTIFCAVLYALAGLMGVTSSGLYADLVIWGGLCLIFAVICVISAVQMGREQKLSAATKDPEISEKKDQ